MQHLQEATRTEAVNELVLRLAEDVRKTRGGNPMSAKLRQTAVGVLVGRPHVTLANQREKEADGAKTALAAACPDSAAFLARCQDLRASGVPLVDELLIVLQAVAASADVRTALSAPYLDGEAGSRDPGLAAPAGPQLGTSHNSAPAGPSAPPRDQEAVPGTPVATPAAAGRSISIDPATLETPWISDHRNPIFGAVTTPSAQSSPLMTARKHPGYAPLLGAALADPQSKFGLSRLSSSLNLDSAVPLVGDLFDFSAGGPPLEGGAAAAWLTEPAWNSRRPRLTGQDLFLNIERQAEDSQEPPPLAAFPRSIQERLLLDDLLYAFLGLDGRYCRARRVQMREGIHVTYQLQGGADPSLAAMVERVLPLCEYAVIVERFAETRAGQAWGAVAQALAGALQAVLEDWHLLVVQLEHQLLSGSLTLQALWYYCQQPLASMRMVAFIAGEAAARGLRGAGLLNLLNSRAAAVAGDAQAFALVQQLLSAAAVPYFRSLERWLCEGLVDDPFGEFLVQEDQDVDKELLTEDEQSAYWYQRYTLRVVMDGRGNPLRDHAGEPLHDVPSFLEPVKETILTTGKYLNAIRECGRPVVRPLSPNTHIEYDPQQGYLSAIEAAFHAASAELLGLMQHELGLGSTLAALKHYFLLDRGDLVMTFLDTAEGELAKPATDASLARLQAQLDLAVRSSSAAGDPLSESLVCCLDTRSLLGMLMHISRSHRQEPPKASPAAKGRQRPAAGGSSNAMEVNLLKSRLGREAFMLSLKVEWPLSVVISRAAQAQYQLIFRHLFELKNVERELNHIWRICQATRRLAREGQKGVLKRCYSLCQQMMHFFHQFLLYTTFEVLEPLWHTLQAHIRASTTVDQIIAHHKEFLRRVMKGCLLSRKVKLLRNLIDLKAVAHQFALTSSRLAADSDPSPSTSLSPPLGWEREGRAARVAEATARLEAALSNERLVAAITELEASFSSKLRTFISGLEEVHRVAQTDKSESREELDGLQNLISRLDFNDFFKGEPDYRGLLGPPLRL